MVDAGTGVIAACILLVAVSVYGYAGNFELIHNGFKRAGETAANSLFDYKTAVRRVDIRRSGCAVVFKSRIIVLDAFGKILVYVFY